MYRSSSPEDNTAVIRMVKGFQRFLEESPAGSKENPEYSFLGRTNLFEEQFNINRSSNKTNLTNSSVPLLGVSDINRTSNKPNLTTNSSVPLLGVSDINKSNKSNKRTSFSGIYGENSVRKKRPMLTLSVDEKAELIASKSKAANLEVQLKTLDCERRRSDIEDGKKRKLMADKFAKDQEEIDVLRRKYKELVEQKEIAVDDLATFEKKHNSMKTELNAKIDELHREKMHLKTSLEELQCGMDSNFDELKQDLIRTNMEYAQCQQRLEEAETELTMGRGRVEETKDLIADYTDLKSRCELAEGKVKHLEQKLLEQEEASLVVMKSQKQLASYLELEKENKKLREDNLLYRDSASNSLILEEKLSSLTSKLAEREKLRERVEELLYENEELMKKLKQWECTDVTGSNPKARSPADLTRIIGELQTSSCNLTAVNIQWETRARLTDSLMESKQDECVQLVRQNIEVSAKNEQLEDKNQKLQRRLTLLTTERDGLRHVLSSYENEEGSAGRIHMQQVEEKVNQYNQQIKVLEVDLASARSEAVNQKNKYLELKQENEKLKASHIISNENIKTMVEDEKLREEFKELKEKYEKMNAEKEILELRIEKKEMQGDYDPFKTKALHLRNNPFEVAAEAYQKRYQETFEENEKMRKKIIKLQTTNEELEESMNVSKLIKTSKPMEDAMKRVDEWKLKYKRLEEQYNISVRKFLFAVKNLLGYSIKEISPPNTYRIQSMYTENSDDFFIFQCEQKKGTTTTGVIETQFLKQWLKELDKYHDSLPLFLATVNLELFDRTEG